MYKKYYYWVVSYQKGVFGVSTESSIEIGGTEIPSIEAIQEAIGPPPEEALILGEHQIYTIDAKSLIMLYQTRGGRNPKISSIQASMESETNLLNLPDTALLPEELFEEYLAFTKELWGEYDETDEHEPVFLNDEAYYPLVIAGHSRVLSAQNISSKQNRPVHIKSKRHIVSSIDDIIRVQLDENLHADVPPENAALALAEAWHWEKKKNQDISKSEFIEWHHLGGYDSLNRAIAYAGLPKKIRSLVGLNSIHFGVAVEMGVANETYLKYEMLSQTGKTDIEDLTPEEEEAIENAAEERLIADLAFYVDPKRGGNRSQITQNHIIQNRKGLELKTAQLILENGAEAVPDLRSLLASGLDFEVTGVRRRIMDMLANLRRNYAESAVPVIDLLADYAGLLESNDGVNVDTNELRELIERARELMIEYRGQDIEAPSYKEAMQRLN